MPQEKKKLDHIVKFGLGVFFGAFALIFGGMFLTRPDRSIPPYSIGAQEGTAVAVHVPGYTTDAGLETLIYRFQKVAREGELGRMKIQPTTPEDPVNRYRRITIYVFTHEAWAEPQMLRRYLAARQSDSPDDRALREAFEKAVRGLYRRDESGEEGRLGPIDQMGRETPATAAYMKVLFRGPIASSPTVNPRPSPTTPSNARARQDP